MAAWRQLSGRAMLSQPERRLQLLPGIATVWGRQRIPLLATLVAETRIRMKRCAERRLKWTALTSVLRQSGEDVFFLGWRHRSRVRLLGSGIVGLSVDVVRYEHLQFGGVEMGNRLGLHRVVGQNAGPQSGIDDSVLAENRRLGQHELLVVLLEHFLVEDLFVGDKQQELVERDVAHAAGGQVDSS